MAAVVSHTVIVLALVIAYVVVTLNGDDGTALLALAGGYLGGAAVQRSASP